MTLDEIADMRRRHDALLPTMQTGSMHYADGVAAVMERGELLTEVEVLKPAVDAAWEALHAAGVPIGTHDLAAGIRWIAERAK